eukprot:2548633-Rhodomonas_salina.2
MQIPCPGLTGRAGAAEGRGGREEDACLPPPHGPQLRLLKARGCNCDCWDRGGATATVGFEGAYGDGAVSDRRLWHAVWGKGGAWEGSVGLARLCMHEKSICFPV